MTEIQERAVSEIWDLFYQRQGVGLDENLIISALMDNRNLIQAIYDEADEAKKAKQGEVKP